MKKIFSAALLLAACTLAAQTVAVSASHLQDGNYLANGTIYWTPVLANGTPITYHNGAGGIATATPVSTAVTNGTFSLSAMPDSAYTTPLNLCWRVTLETSNGSKLLTPCAQPGASNYWYSAGIDNFDNFLPGVAPLPLYGTTTINGLVGPWTFVGPGVSCNATTLVCTASGGGGSSCGSDPTMGGSGICTSDVTVNGSVLSASTLFAEVTVNGATI